MLSLKNTFLNILGKMNNSLDKNKEHEEDLMHTVDEKLNSFLDKFLTRSESENATTNPIESKKRKKKKTLVDDNEGLTTLTSDIAYGKDDELFFFDLEGDKNGLIHSPITQNRAKHTYFKDKDTVVDIVDSDLEITYSSKNKIDNYSKKKENKNTHITSDKNSGMKFCSIGQKEKEMVTNSISKVSHHYDDELFFFDISGNPNNGVLTQSSAKHVQFEDQDTIVDMVDSDIEITYSGKKIKKRISMDNEATKEFQPKKNRKYVDTTNTSVNLEKNILKEKKIKKKLKKIADLYKSDMKNGKLNRVDNFFSANKNYFPKIVNQESQSILPDKKKKKSLYVKNNKIENLIKDESINKRIKILNKNLTGEKTNNIENSENVYAKNKISKPKLYNSSVSTELNEKRNKLKTEIADSNLNQVVDIQMPSEKIKKKNMTYTNIENIEEISKTVKLECESNGYRKKKKTDHLNTKTVYLNQEPIFLDNPWVITENTEGLLINKKSSTKVNIACSIFNKDYTQNNEVKKKSKIEKTGLDFSRNNVTQILKDKKKKRIKIEDINTMDIEQLSIFNAKSSKIVDIDSSNSNKESFHINKVKKRKKKPKIKTAHHKNDKILDIDQSATTESNFSENVTQMKKKKRKIKIEDINTENIEQFFIDTKKSSKIVYLDGSSSSKDIQINGVGKKIKKPKCETTLYENDKIVDLNQKIIIKQVSKKTKKNKKTNNKDTDDTEKFFSANEKSPKIINLNISTFDENDNKINKAKAKEKQPNIKATDYKNVDFNEEVIKSLDKSVTQMPRKKKKIKIEETNTENTEESSKIDLETSSFSEAHLNRVEKQKKSKSTQKIEDFNNKNQSKEIFEPENKCIDDSSKKKKKSYMNTISSLNDEKSTTSISENSNLSEEHSQLFEKKKTKNIKNDIHNLFKTVSTTQNGNLPYSDNKRLKIPKKKKYKTNDFPEYSLMSSIEEINVNSEKNIYPITYFNNEVITDHKSQGLFKSITRSESNPNLNKQKVLQENISEPEIFNDSMQSSWHKKLINNNSSISDVSTLSKIKKRKKHKQIKKHNLEKLLKIANIATQDKITFEEYLNPFSEHEISKKTRRKKVETSGLTNYSGDDLIGSKIKDIKKEKNINDEANINLNENEIIYKKSQDLLETVVIKEDISQFKGPKKKSKSLITNSNLSNENALKPNIPKKNFIEDNTLSSQKKKNKNGGNSSFSEYSTQLLNKEKTYQNFDEYLNSTEKKENGYIFGKQNSQDIQTKITKKEKKDTYNLTDYSVDSLVGNIIEETNEDINIENEKNVDLMTINNKSPDLFKNLNIIKNGLKLNKNKFHSVTTNSNLNKQHGTFETHEETYQNNEECLNLTTEAQTIDFLNKQNSWNNYSNISKKTKKKKSRPNSLTDFSVESQPESIIGDAKDELKINSKNIVDTTTFIKQEKSYQNFEEYLISPDEKELDIDSKNSQNCNKGILKKTKKKKDKTDGLTDYLVGSIIEVTKEELNTNKEGNDTAAFETHEKTYQNIEEFSNLTTEEQTSDLFNKQNSWNSNTNIFKKTKKKKSRPNSLADFSVDSQPESIIGDAKDELKINSKNIVDTTTFIKQEKSYQNFEEFLNSPEEKELDIYSKNSQNNNKGILKKTKKKDKTDGLTDYLVGSIIEVTKEELNINNKEGNDTAAFETHEKTYKSIEEFQNLTTEEQTSNDSQRSNTNISKKTKEKKGRPNILADSSVKSHPESIIGDVKDKFKIDSKHIVDNTTFITQEKSYQNFEEYLNSPEEKELAIYSKNSQNSNKGLLKKTKKKKDKTDGLTDYLVGSIIEVTKDELNINNKEDNDTAGFETHEKTYQNIEECINLTTEEQTSDFFNKQNSQCSSTNISKKTKKKKGRPNSLTYSSFDSLPESILENAKEELKINSKNVVDTTAFIKQEKPYQNFEEYLNVTTDKQISGIFHKQNSQTLCLADFSMDSKMVIKDNESQDLFGNDEHKEDSIEDIKSFLDFTLQKKKNDKKTIDSKDSDNGYISLIEDTDEEANKVIKENTLKRKKLEEDTSSDKTPTKSKRRKKSIFKNLTIDSYPSDIDDQCSDLVISTNKPKWNVDEIFSEDEITARGRKNALKKKKTSSDQNSDSDSSSYSPNGKSGINNDLTEEEKEVLRKLTVKLPFDDIPPIHKIKRPSKPTLVESYNARLNAKFGPFSKKEDGLIIKNWNRFCKDHNLKVRPQVFFKFKHIFGMAEKVKFLQYLAHGLNDRLPLRVHFRFKTIFMNMKLKKGRFSAKEDNAIINFMNTTVSSKPFLELELLLNRCASSIERRYSFLTSGENKSPIKWDVWMSERMIKGIMEITEIDNVENLEHLVLNQAQWKKLSKILDNIPVKKLQRAWKVTIHSRLFMKENKYDVKEDIIKMMILNGETDFRTISWENYAQNFNGITARKLNVIFRTMMAIVPEKYKNDLKSALEYLSTHMKKRKPHPQLKYTFKNGKLTCKTILEKDT